MEGKIFITQYHASQTILGPSEMKNIEFMKADIHYYKPETFPRDLLLPVRCSFDEFPSFFAFECLKTTSDILPTPL